MTEKGIKILPILFVMMMLYSNHKNGTKSSLDCISNSKRTMKSRIFKKSIDLTVIIIAYLKKIEFYK